MTWSDPIVEEVRRARDAYAARFNYDLQAIFRDLKEQEKRSGRQVVSYADESEAPEPGLTPQPVPQFRASADTTPTHQVSPATDH